MGNDRATTLNDRQKQLVVSARAQLNAILAEIPVLEWNSPLYREIMDLVARLEKLLGY